MPQLPAGRGGINDRGRGGGRWDVVRKKVNNDIEERDHHARRPNYLLKKMRSFQLSKHSTPIPNGKNDIPEDVEDLHEHFRTCTSLTRIREELRNALSEDAERKMGFGLNACARKDENTGKLLLHSIGLNKYLISSGGEGTAAQSRVNQFVLRELLPVREFWQNAIIFI